MLALCTMAAGIFFHSNFGDQSPAVHFLKDVAIARGLLQVAAVGAGRWSLVPVVLPTCGQQVWHLLPGERRTATFY